MIGKITQGHCCSERSCAEPIKIHFNLRTQESGCTIIVNGQMVANNIRFLKVEPEIQQRKMLNSFVISVKDKEKI